MPASTCYALALQYGSETSNILPDPSSSESQRSEWLYPLKNDGFTRKSGDGNILFDENKEPVFTEPESFIQWLHRRGAGCINNVTGRVRHRIYNVTVSGNQLTLPNDDPSKPYIKSFRDHVTIGSKLELTYLDSTSKKERRVLVEVTGVKNSTITFQSETIPNDIKTITQVDNKGKYTAKYSINCESECVRFTTDSTLCFECVKAKAPPCVTAMTDTEPVNALSKAVACQRDLGLHLADDFDDGWRALFTDNPPSPQPVWMWVIVAAGTAFVISLAYIVYVIWNHQLPPDTPVNSSFNSSAFPVRDDVYW